MPPTDKDTAEIIRLLKQAEQERSKAVTQGDLAALTNTVMGGIQAVKTELTSRIDIVEGQVKVHTLAFKAIEMGGIPNVAVNRSIAPRRMSPMPQTIDVEKTAGGGIKITDGAQWEKVLKRLDEQEKALDTIEAERDAAKAAERTAQERQGAVTEYATKQRKLVKKLIAALVAGGPLLGAAAHYLLNWLHQ